MKSKVTLIALLALNLIASAQISKEAVLKDIEVLDSLISYEHVAPYWLNSKEQILNVIDQANTIIQSKENCDESCLVEFLRIMASLGDGHSTVAGNSRYELFGYIPISTRWFNGELRVMRTISPYQIALGSKVVAINNIPIDTVLNKLSAVVPQANPYRFQKFAGRYLHLPGLLYGLGITTSPKETLIRFDKNGDIFDLTLSLLTEEEEEKAQFVSYLDSKKNKAWYQQKNSDYYWFDHDPKEELFYFQYNRVGNMKREGSTAFASRMFNAVDSLEVRKFVLDLRYNGGGSFPLSLKFAQGILDRLDINRYGRLFIITGYDTFSAAMDMLNEMELRSRAIIVGEYPCDHPSRPGDPEEYLLPNLDIKVYLSSLYHPTVLVNDQRTSSSLDKEIITSWDDYKNGVDPVLEYIKGMKEEDKTVLRTMDFESSLGRYNYAPTRDLKLKDVSGELWLEIDRGLESPLYNTGKSEYETEIPGIQVIIANDSIELRRADGIVSSHSKLTTDRLSPVELLYTGQFEKARQAYLEIKEKHPEYIELKDHMMSFLANRVYFEQRKYPDVDASALARGILELGISLNDDAPFCTFTQRFYQ